MRTPDSRPEIPKEEVVTDLWNRYKQTPEFRDQHRTESINSAHPLVKAAESKGLEKLIKSFIGSLARTEDLREEYVSRPRSVWLDEWRTMHTQLAKYVYKARGEFRAKGHDVYFGDPGDEDKYGIPPGGNPTLLELYTLADAIPAQLSRVNQNDIDDVCSFLARVHFGFIRIHPFGDGNGRIARVVTDQLAVSLGFPPVIAGFPRLHLEEKRRYHAAIRGCIEDPSCRSLYSWIKFKIESQINDIA